MVHTYPHGALARGHKIGSEAQIARVQVVDSTKAIPATQEEQVSVAAHYTHLL